MRGLPHLASAMKRPKEFKKEFVIEILPNFEQISKENPLPTSYFRRQSLVNGGGSTLFNSQALEALFANRIESLLVDPSSLWLICHQRSVHLREELLRNQLMLSNARGTLHSPFITNYNIGNEVAIANLVRKTNDNVLR